MSPIVKRFGELQIGDVFKDGVYFCIKTTNYNGGKDNIIYYNNSEQRWRAFSLEQNARVIVLKENCAKGV